MVKANIIANAPNNNFNFFSFIFHLFLINGFLLFILIYFLKISILPARQFSLNLCRAANR